jgi:hypothetical protein
MLQKILPAYLYQEYLGKSPNGDYHPTDARAGYAIAGYAIAGSDTEPVQYENLQAFFVAYNQLSQEMYDKLLALNLPIYTQQTGIVLDWVGAGLYGLVRPSLGTAGTASFFGIYNTENYDTTTYGRGVKSTAPLFYQVNDDFYKRILTWQFYKGDGFQFTTTWLKRRVLRFLYGTDGIDFPIDNTYQISITYSLPNNILITIPDIPNVSIYFQQAILNGVLNVPFNYAISVAF